MARRLQATVTAAHEPSDIEQAMEVIVAAGRKVGIIWGGSQP
jgi:hypothetical protein